MPRSQVATVANFDFGAPASATQVLKFRALRGGKLDLRIEADNDALVVSAEVSADGTIWSATTADNNTTAITSAAIPAKQERDYVLTLRDTLDAFLRFTASGRGRGRVQIRGGESMLQEAVI